MSDYTDEEVEELAKKMADVISEHVSPLLSEDSFFSLGTIPQNNWLTEEVFNEILEEANNEDPISMAIIGDYYFRGNTEGFLITVDINKAEYWLKKAASHNNYLALLDLGLLYIFDKPEPNIAGFWLEKVINQNEDEDIREDALRALDDNLEKNHRGFWKFKEIEE